MRVLARLQGGQLLRRTRLYPLIMSTGHRTYTQPTEESREDKPPTRPQTVLLASHRHVRATRFRNYPKPEKFQRKHSETEYFNFNDPLAGSPTRTLLRLLLPLNAQV